MRDADENRPRHSRCGSRRPRCAARLRPVVLRGDERDDARPVILPEIIQPILGSRNGHAMLSASPGASRRSAGTISGLSCAAARSSIAGPTVAILGHIEPKGVHDSYLAAGLPQTYSFPSLCFTILHNLLD